MFTHLDCIWPIEITIAINNVTHYVFEVYITNTLRCWQTYYFRVESGWRQYQSVLLGFRKSTGEPPWYLTIAILSHPTPSPIELRHRCPSLGLCASPRIDWTITPNRATGEVLGTYEKHRWSLPKVPFEDIHHMINFTQHDKPCNRCCQLCEDPLCAVITRTTKSTRRQDCVLFVRTTHSKYPNKNKM